MEIWLGDWRETLQRLGVAGLAAVLACDALSALHLMATSTADRMFQTYPLFMTLTVLTVLPRRRREKSTADMVVVLAILFLLSVAVDLLSVWFAVMEDVPAID